MATQFGVLSIVSVQNKIIINDDEQSEHCLMMGSEFLEMNYFGDLGTIWRPKFKGVVFECEIFLERDNRTSPLAHYKPNIDRWETIDKFGILRQFSWMKLESFQLRDGDKLIFVNLDE